MSPETARPATWGSRPGLDDLRVAAESEASVNPNTLKTQAVLRLRRRQQAERLHALGGRAVFEFVDELARHHPEIAADLDRRLAVNAGLDPEIPREIGGDRFAPMPMRSVEATNDRRRS